MSRIETAVEWIVGVANDPMNGYDQVSRWGPDYDCSSLVISAWEAAGVPVKSRGATYTGNMLLAFLQAGFVKVTDGTLKRGDVLLNVQSHTAIYIGNGQIVEAGGNEWGGITGGQPGDQTGNEIRIRNYYNFPWDYVLRYDELEEEEIVEQAWHDPTETMMTALPLLQYGHRGHSVKVMQGLLGMVNCDGLFGEETETAVMDFQRAHNLLVDGECGCETWGELII